MERAVRYLATRADSTRASRAPQHCRGSGSSSNARPHSRSERTRLLSVRPLLSLDEQAGGTDKKVLGRKRASHRPPSATITRGGESQSCSRTCTHPVLRSRCCTPLTTQPDISKGPSVTVNHRYTASSN